MRQLTQSTSGHDEFQAFHMKSFNTSLLLCANRHANTYLMRALGHGMKHSVNPIAATPCEARKEREQPRIELLRDTSRAKISVSVATS